MIHFSVNFQTWTLEADAAAAGAQQYDNESVVLSFTGTFPAEYTAWQLLLNHKEHFTILPLTASADGYAATLTKEHLCFAGYYSVQLLGSAGTKQRHTDIARFFNGQSLSGDARWPSLPASFSDALAAVQQAAAQTQSALSAKQDKTDLSLSTTAKTVTAAINELNAGKVDAETGKGLSANDFTAAAKAKVDAIPANPSYTDTVYDDTALDSRVCTLEGKASGWDAKGTYSKPAGGIPASDLAAGVIPALPSNVSAFTNDSGYLTLATLPRYNGGVV